MAKRAGARVIATASSQDRLDRLSAYGLDDGINYSETGFVAVVKALTSGRGADVIVDSVGGKNLQKSLQALAYRGRCVSFGDAGRDGTTTLNVSTLRGNNQRLIGYFLGAELFSSPRAYDMITGLFQEVASRELDAVIDRTFPLSDAQEPHAYIEARQAFGRVVLRP